LEGYQLPSILFTEDEANALITAEQLVLKNKVQSFTENYCNAIVKIKSVLKHSQKGKVAFIAFCRLRSEFRAFRIDFIQNLYLKAQHLLRTI